MKASQFSKYSNIFGTTGNIDYVYNAVGQKLQKISFLEIKEEKKIDTIYIITEHVHSLDFIF